MGGTVYDLFGGLREWAFDYFQDADATKNPDDTCWLSPGVRTNPRCEHLGHHVTNHSVRGGSFLQPASQGAAASRWEVPAPTIDVGIRCMRQ